MAGQAHTLRRGPLGGDLPLSPRNHEKNKRVKPLR